MIRLIIEKYGTTQVADDKWRDATTYVTVDADLPAVEALLRGYPGDTGLSARVIGAEVLRAAPAEVS